MPRKHRLIYPPNGGYRTQFGGGEEDAARLPWLGSAFASGPHADDMPVPPLGRPRRRPPSGAGHRRALGASDEGFRGVVQDGLKAHRKQNAFMVFGRQSSAGVLRSERARTFLERRAMKLFPA